MKRLLILILIAFSFTANAQWQGASGVWQKNSVLDQWRFNAGPNGIFWPYDVFEKIQDGLISGGGATTNGDSLIVALGVARINSINYSFATRTFADIAPSATGLTRILIVYSNASGLLDSIAGTQSNNPVEPTLPANTVRVVTVNVSDAGLGTPTVDLSGYAKLDVSNTFLEKQIFNKDLIEHRSSVGFRTLMRSFINGNYIGDYGFFGDGRFNISTTTFNPPTPTLSSQRVLDIFIDRKAKFYGTVEGLNPVNAQDFVTKSYGDANYLTGTPDTTIYRTVANSYTLASGQPRLLSGTNIKTVNSTSLLGSGNIAAELPLTFGYGLTRSTNTITADTTSATALVGKPRLTSSLNLKANIASPTLTGTLTTPNINVTTSTLATSNYRLATRNQTGGAIGELDLGSVTGGLIYDGVTKTVAIAASADRTTAGEVITSSNRTITLSDFGSNGMLTVYCTTTGGDVTITLPSPTVMRYLEITIIKVTASNNVIISGSANINGSASVSESAVYKSYTLVSNGTQYFIKGERP